MSGSRHHRFRGFTLVETAAVVAAVGLLGGMALMLQPAGGKGGGGPRETARQIKDSQQLRGIHQGLIMWAQNNNDEYPLPSRIDRKDATVAEKGRAKDTTANIFSLTVFNGMVTPEVYISPLEKSPHVRTYKDYQYDEPRAAVKPRTAMWDPAMRAGLSEESPGHISYAHLQPAGPRRSAWSNTFAMHEFALSNRGPEIRVVDRNENGSVTPRFARPDSLTLTFIGDPDTWSGHVVGNDNAVELLRNHLGDGKEIPPVRGRERRPRYEVEGKRWPDVIFFDETETAFNNFLGIFTKAGEEPADYSSIWD
jgi:hypothetical protein